MKQNWETFKELAESAESNQQLESAEKMWWNAVDSAASISNAAAPVAFCLENLGDFYSRLRQFENAESVYSSCIEKKIVAFGLAHAEVASTLSKLAHCQAIQNKTKEAEDSLKQCLLICFICLGVEHPLTKWTIERLHTAYSKQGKIFDLSEVSDWGNVPTASTKVASEQAICRTCHRAYKGVQCSACTEIGLLAINNLQSAPERLVVIIATSDIRAGSIVTLACVGRDTRLVYKTDTFHDVDSVLGKSAKNLIRQGQALKTDDIE